MKLKDVVQPKPNEQILLMVRESRFSQIGTFLLFTLWFLIPFFFLYPLFRMGTMGVVIFCVLVFSGLFLCWRAFRKWSHTLFVITDHRIIDIDQRGIFDRVVTESSFDHIDEVSYRMHGVWSMIFRYGTVYVKRSGSAADLKFEYIRHPARVQDLINDLRKAVHE